MHKLDIRPSCPQGARTRLKHIYTIKSQGMGQNSGRMLRAGIAWNFQLRILSGSDSHSVVNQANRTSPVPTLVSVLRLVHRIVADLCRLKDKERSHLASTCALGLETFRPPGLLASTCCLNDPLASSMCRGIRDGYPWNQVEQRLLERQARARSCAVRFIALHSGMA